MGWRSGLVMAVAAVLAGSGPALAWDRAGPGLGQPGQQPRGFLSPQPRGFLPAPTGSYDPNAPVRRLPPGFGHGPYGHVPYGYVPYGYVPRGHLPHGHGGVVIIERRPPAAAPPPASPRPADPRGIPALPPLR